ncbi:SEC-C metal-binding domain-containing protein [Bdellovibrionota bacterium FG-2]
MSETPRNEPCPCGSGRKYKRCCLVKDNPTLDTSLPWKQIRAARDSLNAQMLELSMKLYDRDTLEEAWEEWCCGVDEPLEMHGTEFVAFMSWFLITWNLWDEEDVPVPSIASHLREEFRDKLSPIEFEYLTYVLNEPYSYYEILEPKPGDGYQLRDLLRGTEHFVHERSGSHGVRAGDFLYGRLARVGDVTIFDAISDILLPLKWKNDILELRQDIRKLQKLKKNEMPGSDDLIACAPLIRGLYRHFRDAAMNPQPPRMTNTDGDPLSFNKIIFDIDDANVVFEALHPLCINGTREELWEDADKDSSGQISKADFPWLKKGNKTNKGWDNTVLGHITLEKTKMTVEVNSLSRAEAFKKIAAKLCGKSIRYKTTLIEPFETKMKELQERQTPEQEAEDRAEQEDLKNHPEIRAQIQAMYQSHMEHWVTDKIPALGGKTPTQAVKTPEGRERVENLLADFERSSGVMADKAFELGVLKKVREKLGLT